MIAIILAVFVIAAVYLIGGSAEGWSQVIATAATALAIVLAFPLVYCWELSSLMSLRQRSRMFPVALIVIGALGAILSVGTAIIGIQWLNATSNLKIADDKDEPVTELTQPFLKGISLFYGNAQTPLRFTAIPVKTIDRLRLFMDYQRPTPTEDGFLPRERVEAGELSNVVKDKKIETTTVGFGLPGIYYNGEHAVPPEGSPLANTYTPFFGIPNERKSNFIGVGANRARLVIVGPNGEEQRFPFLVIRANQNSDVPLTVVTDGLDTAAQWGTDE